MSIKHVRTALFGCTLVASSLTAQQATTGSQVQRDKEDAMNEAEQLVLTQERIGKRLMAIVADPEKPVPERHEAARLLGKLQYLPAIAVLIRHVDLADPSYESSEERPDLQYPVTVAIAAYGSAAVPHIVDAFVAEREHLRQLLLFLSIRYGKTTDVALRYLRGLEPPDEKDWLRKQNMEGLKKKLTSSFAK
jgi:hypothetical protein